MMCYTLKTILSIVRQYTTLSLPDVCTLAPVHGKAFCARHCEVLENHTPPIPTDIRGFLHFCGVLNNEGAIFNCVLVSILSLINYDMSHYNEWALFTNVLALLDA